MISQALILKSVLVFAAFSITRLYKPLYSSPQCAMRLVNESDPGAYSRHPYWKDLIYDDSCAGDVLEQYVKNQYFNGEKYWMDLFVNTWMVLGVCFALWGLLRGGFSIRSVFPSIMLTIFGYFGASIVLMHTHFQVDITVLCGGILHHARAEKPGIDFKGGSVTEGYLYCGMFNRFFYTLVIYWLITRDSRLKKYLNPWVAMGMLQLLLVLALNNVGKQHPLYHAMAINGSTPEMDNAWPYSMAWRAYKHCIVHHDNGLSFSGDLILDPFFDGFLYAFAFLYNNVLKIQLGSTAHYVFTTVVDMAMGALGVGLIYVFLHIIASLAPSLVRDKDLGVSGKKLN